MQRDPLLERRAFPIAHRVAVQHRMGLRNGGGRGPGRRLADLHMQDGPPLRLQPVGFPAASDGVKRIDIGNHAPPLTRPATLSHLPRWTLVTDTILEPLSTYGPPAPPPP